MSTVMPQSATPASPSAREEPRRRPSHLRTALEALASLRVTVVLFVLAFILVFYGTWAQVDAGIWTVVNDYFRAAVVWIPLKVVFFHAFDIPGALPYPGGWLLGGILLANLLAAHAIRFRVDWKRSGILLIHSGLVVMMLSELITGLYAIEGRMTIVEKQSSNFVEHDRHAELAVVDVTDPKREHVVAVSSTSLADGKVLRDLPLPFAIEVIRYMPNSDVFDLEHAEIYFSARKKGMPDNPADAGLGLRSIAIEKSITTGTDTEQRIELPSAYVRILDKDGKSLGTFLLSTYFGFLNEVPDEIRHDGKSYRLSLRFERSYRPYTIQLEEFRHDVYVGTTTPKNYSSDVRIIDPETGENRPVKISMNNPLRYRGETFYQSALHPFAKGTVLQVVRNPGWLMPYISCAMVTIGMLIHFGLHLTSFLRRRFAP